MWPSWAQSTSAMRWACQRSTASHSASTPKTSRWVAPYLVPPFLARVMRRCVRGSVESCEDKTSTWEVGVVQGCSKAFSGSLGQQAWQDYNHTAGRAAESGRTGDCMRIHRLCSLATRDRSLEPLGITQGAAATSPNEKHFSSFTCRVCYSGWLAHAPVLAWSLATLLCLRPRQQPCLRLATLSWQQAQTWACWRLLPGRTCSSSGSSKGSSHDSYYVQGTYFCRGA